VEKVSVDVTYASMPTYDEYISNYKCIVKSIGGGLLRKKIALDLICGDPKFSS
jgi:hypothetical protein